MKSNPLEFQSVRPEIGVYDCEIHIKFRLIEEKALLCDRDQLLDVLLEALACGEDEYLESTHLQVEAQEISETEASPQMRRQIIRLRNSSDMA